MMSAVAPEDAFGDEADAPPVADPSRERPTVRPRGVSARQRSKATAASKAAAVRAALGGHRRDELELPEVLSELPAAPPIDHVSKELIALGDPPDDPLAAQAWLHRAMVKASRDAILDENLTAAERRKELRAFAKTAAVLLPDARRWQAEELIGRAAKGEAERHNRGPDLEPIPAELELDDGAPESG